MNRHPKFDSQLRDIACTFDELAQTIDRAIAGDVFSDPTGSALRRAKAAAEKAVNLARQNSLSLKGSQTAVAQSSMPMQDRISPKIASNS